MNNELIGKVHCLDFFELSRQVEDASVDLYLGDLPYGVTACKWDSVIPLEPMWAELKRIMKPRGAIVLTATQPFTSQLVMSNPTMFRYAWVWVKSIATGFLDAKRKPLKANEDVLVFGVKPPVYYPVMTKGEPYTKINRVEDRARQYGKFKNQDILSNGERYPTNIIRIGYENSRYDSTASRIENLHPTQKPVALFEYLIRTYTRPDDLVADFTVGSGTTAVASRNLNRRFIVGDFTPEYCEIARKRLAQPFTPQMFDETPDTREKPTQASMFEEVSHA